MVYNFDEPNERRKTFSYKWDTLPMNFGGRSNLIAMWVADTDFKCPQEVINAVTAAAEKGIYGYSYPAERPIGSIYANWLKKRHDWTINPQNTVFCAGVVAGLGIAIRALTEKNDGVIIMPPVYYPFREIVENNGRRVRENPLVKCDKHWEIDFDDLEKKASEKDTKLLLLCSPHNPVCRVFTKAELEKIGDICIRNNVRIVSDEIHSDLVFKPNKHIPTASVSPEISRITVTAYAPSKTFNMAGIPCSVLIADDDIVFKAVADEVTRCFHITNLFGTAALEAVYEHGDEYVDQLLPYLWENYELLDKFMKANCPKITVQKPEGTYLMWLDCTALEMSFEQLQSFWLDKAGVAPDFGKWFGTGGDGFVRLNIGCPRSTLRQALENIKTAYNSL